MGWSSKWEVTIHFIEIPAPKNRMILVVTGILGGISHLKLYVSKNAEASRIYQTSAKIMYTI